MPIEREKHELTEKLGWFKYERKKMRLANGLETMELGVTSWRVIINDNFTKLYTKEEVEANFVKKSDYNTLLDELNTLKARIGALENKG